MIATKNNGSLFDILRLIIFSIIALFINQSLRLGINTVWLIFAAILGIIISKQFLKRNASGIKAVFTHLLVIIIASIMIKGINVLIIAGSDSSTYDFLVPQFQDDLIIVFGFYSIVSISTWFFWTRASSVTFEGVICGIILITILSGHRQYHIDVPSELSSLTWKLPILQHLQIQPQHLLLTIGGVFIILLSTYFYLASDRQIIGSRVVLKNYHHSKKFSWGIISFVFGILLATLGILINARYSEELSRASNGVGLNQNTKEGESNLGFHSATSPTKQPAALVRLEGDYQNNPWSPMIYFREGAVSEFTGHELVKATKEFDTDVPRIAIGEPLMLPETDEPFRELVIQSIYLITKHDAPFTLDFPRRIVPIKNPYPERFIQAYQAVSYAPSHKIKELIGKKLGNSAWTQAQWEHYLRSPGSKSTQAPDENIYLKDSPVLDENNEDLRYLSLARSLTARFFDPVEKALQITKFLSEKSLYTRNPGHKITTGGDPVAPYLFSSEKRGYCVHFSHAAVYMMRLLGIPARIATGYLVDTNYAKDGHLLLHLGDRHAWPEVYIEGYGWMVFDVTPQHAENEPAIIPDEKLLDELMNKLDPAQELLVSSPESPEKPSSIYSISAKKIKNILFYMLSILIFLVITTKIYLRYAYIFPGDKIKNAYISISALATDFGVERNFGETRKEYLSRIVNTEINLPEFLNQKKYAQTLSSLPDLKNIQKIKSDIYSLHAQAGWKSFISKFFAFLNIKSIINYKRL